MGMRAIQGSLHLFTVFANGLLQQQLATVKGPVDGHPELTASYRAELSGIIAALYIIYRVSLYYNIIEGGMTLYCDNKGALQNAFKPIKPGVTPYFNTDHDLLEVAQALLPLIPIVISTSWVKGHYQGKNKQYQHVLNDEADRLVGQYQEKQYTHYSNRKPTPPPNYRIRLEYDSSIVTAKLRHVLVSHIHDKEIKVHIMRKSNWTPTVFQKVHWDAHERAFRRLPRFSQYITAKLLHGLVNTNRQNSMFYGQSPLCPICNQEEESTQHVFTCPHADATQHRNQCLEDLWKSLSSVSTPVPVIKAIVHGFTQWSNAPTNTHIRALTAGSLRGPDAVLTSAFHEQVRKIGWFQFCLGHVSTKWASAVSQYNANPDPQANLQWSSQLITILWHYSRSVWKYRNEKVHGSTVEEQAQHRLSQLREKIIQFFAHYAANPSCILNRHRSLFTSRSVEEHLSSTYDVMAAWIRSVEEAFQVAEHYDAHHREIARQFFRRTNQSDASDSDSTYSGFGSTVSLSTPSLDPTVVTTVTYNTQSSAASSASRFDHIHYDGDDDSTITIDLELHDSFHASFHTDVHRAADGSVCLQDGSAYSSSTGTSNNGWDVH